jgi:hypothetical protein
MKAVVELSLVRVTISASVEEITLIFCAAVLTLIGPRSRVRYTMNTVRGVCIGVKSKISCIVSLKYDSEFCRAFEVFKDTAKLGSVLTGGFSYS